MTKDTKRRGSSAQRASAARERQGDLLKRLEAGIADLTTSDSWRRFLDVQARFHHYSFNNCLLIALQCPSATQVAGFNSWRSLGCGVRKGEKALWILAPMVYRQADEEADERERVVRGFKFVPVFDVSQTDGPDLPAVCTRLEGDDPAGHFEQLVAIARAIGYSVDDHRFEGGCNGDCSFVEKRIRVEAAISPIQRVKTLIHEIAHAKCHEGFDNRAVAELEAESVAYLVCQALGIDSTEYSFGYVATWAGGGDQAIATLKASGTRIQKTAAAIVEGLEWTDAVADVAA
jgi:antirestriction protein ArdC